jgi:hypothetical protein
MLLKYLEILEICRTLAPARHLVAGALVGLSLGNGCPKISSRFELVPIEFPWGEVR